MKLSKILGMTVPLQARSRYFSRLVDAKLSEIGKLLSNMAERSFVFLNR